MDHHLEMTLSREEFLRLLPGGVGLAFTIGKEGAFQGCDGPLQWRIHLRPLPELRLGSVCLPRHRVEIHLDGCSEDEAAAFLARFHRGFQRGGG
jgi:hypothetical protein